MLGDVGVGTAVGDGRGARRGDGAGDAALDAALAVFTVSLLKKILVRLNICHHVMC